MEQDIAAAALFLAAKNCEQFCKLRTFVQACVRVSRKRPQGTSAPSVPVAENSKEFLRWRDTIIFYEELLLIIVSDFVLVIIYEITW